MTIYNKITNHYFSHSTSKTNLKKTMCCIKFVQLLYSCIKCIVVSCKKYYILVFNTFLGVIQD